MTRSAIESLDQLDLWAPAPLDDQPRELLEAIERRDWDLASQLGDQGYGAVRLFGRQIRRLARAAPYGLTVKHDRRRLVQAASYGDWLELIAYRDDASADKTMRMVAEVLINSELPPIHEPMTFVGAYPRHIQAALAFGLDRSYGALRRKLRTSGDWSWPGHAGGRGIQYRQITAPLAIGMSELWGGRLDVTIATLDSCATLGDERDMQREVAHDLAALARVASGAAGRPRLRMMERLTRHDGPTPAEAGEFWVPMVGLLDLVSPALFGELSRLLERVAIRFGSPKRLLYASSWRLAAHLDSTSRGEAEALVARAAGAAPGLRALPELVLGIVARDPGRLKRAADMARAAVNVPLQISALTWLAATQPSPRLTRHLSVLICMTQWRRPLLVTGTVLAQASLALAGAGHRSRALLEFAVASGQSDAILQVAEAHATDATLSSEVRALALGIAARLGTPRAQAFIRRAESEPGPLADFALQLRRRPPKRMTLTGREAEVLNRARQGLTNKQIGAELSISVHTVARHVDNARAKLGASNRAEAVARFLSLPPDSG